MRPAASAIQTTVPSRMSTHSPSARDRRQHVAKNAQERQRARDQHSNTPSGQQCVESDHRQGGSCEHTPPKDAWLTMPPLSHAYQGRDAIGAFLRGAEERRGAPMRMIATRANGQPAFSPV